jgi:hypothetical protein
MDKFKERFVFTFPFIKALGNKTIHTELQATLGAAAYSPA